MTTLAAYLHQINPVALDLFGLKIRWYGLSYLTGFLLAGLILHSLGKKRRVLVPPAFAMDAIMILIFGVVVGGRLGYVLVYQQSLITDFSGAFPYWGVLAIHKGGMASHGGMLGVLAACWWISRGFRAEDGRRVGAAPFLHACDLACLIALPGLMLGRLANFINGELLGRIAAMPGEPAPWWAVKFPTELGTKHAPTLTPEQGLKLTQLLKSVQVGDEPEAASIDRLIAKIQSGSRELALQLEPLLAARHPSQLYQAACEGLVLAAILWTVWARPRKPGVLTAWFLLSYGVLRILVEQYWRLPDDLATQYFLGLTRGQWLSVGMLGAGAALLSAAARRPGPMFSWRTELPADAAQP